MKYCTNCGQRLSNSPNFCGECGERLVENVKDSYADPELTEESSLEEKLEIFNPQIYIIEFLKVNIPNEILCCFFLGCFHNNSNLRILKTLS